MNKPVSAVPNNKNLTMADIKEGSLFICPGVGVLRKTGHSTGHNNKTDKTHVIYPNETVRLLAKKGA